jgi:hypothetical protein
MKILSYNFILSFLSLSTSLKHSLETIPLLAQVGELVRKSPEVLKLISGGKVLQDGPTLQEQGVKVTRKIFK